MDKGHHTEEFWQVGSKVRKAMTEYAMVLRWGVGLEECRRALSGCESQFKEMKAKAKVSPTRYFETRNMILTARLIAERAEMRMESLGSHFREDSSETRLTTTGSEARSLTNIEPMEVPTRRE